MIQKKISNSDLVSVVIPSYNCSSYLEELFNSIMRQTFTNYEVILIDDGSTDDTKEMVDRYKGIKYILLKINLGPQRAREVGWKIGKGKYFVFLDADTILKPTYLEELKKALDNYPTAGFSYCDRVIGLERNEDTMWIRKKSGEFSKERLCKGNYISFCSMVRKEAIQDFDMELNKGRLQDWDFWLSIVMKGWGAVYVPGFLFVMYMRPGGVSANMKQWNKSVEYIKQKYKIGEV